MDGTKIWSYGCDRPVLGKDLLDEQLYRAWRYDDLLAQIEIARRGAWRAIHRDHPEIAPLAAEAAVAEAAVEAAYQALRDKRAGAGRRADDEEEREAIEPLKRALWAAEKAVTAAGKTVRARVEAIVGAVPAVIEADIRHKEAKKSLGPRSRTRTAARVALAKAREAALAAADAAGDLSADDVALSRALSRLAELESDLGRRAQAVSGLYSGTYILINRIAKEARGKAQSPRRRRYEGEGRVGVHFGEGGISTADLLAGSSVLQILPGRPRPSRRHPEGVPPRPDHRTLRFRIGSAGRAPIWVELPMTIQRPLPDGQIKDAWILRRRVGLRYEYRVQFVVVSKEFLPATQPAGQGVVAINLGWRRKIDDAGELTGEIRVAYWVDDQGHEGEILVPNYRPTTGSYKGLGVKKPNDLHSIRDERFDLTRARLEQWLAIRESPEWLQARTRGLAQWRAPRKLAALLKTWERSRIDGDSEILDILRKWAKTDRHLYAWESHQSARRIGHRRKIYQEIATDFSRRYAVILVDDMDLRTFAAIVEEAELKADRKAQRVTSRIAAPGEMRDEIKKAGVKRGATVVDEDTAYMSRTHVGCNGDLIGPAKQSVLLICSKCGAVVDQDENNCRNRLARFASGEPVRETGKVLAPSVKRRSSENQSTVTATDAGPLAE